MKEGSGNGASLSMVGLSGDPEGYVKEGSGNRHLSPLGPCWGSRREDH